MGVVFCGGLAVLSFVVFFSLLPHCDLAGRFAAQTGQQWVDMMDKSATGLYGSQWMVLDYNKFTPGKPIQDGTLFVPRVALVSASV